jgi:hypothetical protein
MATAVYSMPARGNRTAPQFDPSRPRELRRYFGDLDFHFTRSQITADQERKGHCCRYVDLDTSELWESLTEFSDITTTYSDFRQAIYKLYPGSGEERRWLVADLEKLVEERSRIGVHSLGDLGDYYRHFIAITAFLRSKSRLSAAEESRIFAKGFQHELWDRISHRLQLKFPDHFPDDPYSLDVIHEAAQFVLHGTSSSQPTSQIDSSPVIVPAPLEAKFDSLISLLGRISEAIASPAFSHFRSQDSHSDHPLHNDKAIASCNFCGSVEHFIRQCPDAIEYIQLGKCQHNSEGKITLPGGSYVPRDIPGEFMKFRIDEWHRRYPGHISAN